MHHVLPPFLAIDAGSLPVRVPACNSTEQIHLEEDCSTVGPWYHAGQEGVESLQAVASSHCAGMWQGHTITGDVLGDGVNVSPWWILETLQVFLLVLPDTVDGCCILEQMDLVVIHPSWSLQDVDGILHM